MWSKNDLWMQNMKQYVAHFKPPRHIWPVIQKRKLEKMYLFHFLNPILARNPPLRIFCTMDIPHPFMHVSRPFMHVPHPFMHVPRTSMHVPRTSMHVPHPSMHVPRPFMHVPHLSSLVTFTFFSFSRLFLLGTNCCMRFP